MELIINREGCTSEVSVTGVDNATELECKDFISAAGEYLASLMRAVNSPIICSVEGNMDEHDTVFRLRSTNQEYEEQIPKTFMEEAYATSKPFKVHTEQKFTLTTTYNGGTHCRCIVNIDVEMYDPDAVSGEITRKEEAERIAWMALYPFYCNNDGRFTAIKVEKATNIGALSFTTAK